MKEKFRSKMWFEMIFMIFLAWNYRQLGDTNIWRSSLDKGVEMKSPNISRSHTGTFFSQHEGAEDKGICHNCKFNI